MNKQVYNALYAFLTSIIFFFIAILIVLITKDDWQVFGAIEIACIVLLFLMLLVYGAMCNHFGKIKAQNRLRSRVTNIIDTYQKEVHGFRYLQNK